MFEDLAQTALAVYLFVLAGFGLSWALSPLAASWEIARMRMSPRSLEDRVSGQSLVGPVIALGAVGFIISGTVGWSVGALMEGFDPVRFTESSRHINVIATSIGIFAVAAYLANAYARYGSGRPTNLGEKLFELQNGEHGFYATQHMDEEHWAALREQITAPWSRLRGSDQALLEHLLGGPVPERPWELVSGRQVQQMRSAHGVAPATTAERRLARSWWISHPAHWLRITLLMATLGAAIVFAVDSGNSSTLMATVLGLVLGALVVPPLVLRSTRAANRARSAVLARDLLWTQRAVQLIDEHVAVLRAPAQPAGSLPDAAERPEGSASDSPAAPGQNT